MPAEDPIVSTQPGTGDNVTLDKPTGDDVASDKPTGDNVALDKPSRGHVVLDKAQLVTEEVIAQPPQATGDNGTSISKAPAPVKAKAADRPMTKLGDKPTPK